MRAKRLVVGITGGSGAMIAQRFLMNAVLHFDEIYLCLSRQAYQVIETELEIKLDLESWNTTQWLGKHHDNIKVMPEKDYFLPPASGSFKHDGMVIVPCSMGTAGRIANGISDNLVTRAADVCLKENRKLILVPREMPWNLIALRNMTQLAEAGATILPASPAWYQKPRTIEDLADTVVARILQNLGIDQQIFPEWAVSKTSCNSEFVQKS